MSSRSKKKKKRQQDLFWFGRAPIIKMNVLPRILSLLQILPIKIPLRILFLRFAGTSFGSPSILGWARLVTPKLKGGGLATFIKDQRTFPHMKMDSKKFTLGGTGLQINLIIITLTSPHFAGVAT